MVSFVLFDRACISTRFGLWVSLAILDDNRISITTSWRIYKWKEYLLLTNCHNLLPQNTYNSSHNKLRGLNFNYNLYVAGNAIVFSAVPLGNASFLATQHPRPRTYFHPLLSPRPKLKLTGIKGRLAGKNRPYRRSMYVERWRLHFTPPPPGGALAN